MSEEIELLEKLKKQEILNVNDSKPTRKIQQKIGKIIRIMKLAEKIGFEKVNGMDINKPGFIKQLKRLDIERHNKEYIEKEKNKKKEKKNDKKK